MLYFMDRFDPRKPTKIFLKVAPNQWSAFAYNPKYKKHVWFKVYTTKQMVDKINQTTHVVKLLKTVNDSWHRAYIAN